MGRINRRLGLAASVAMLVAGLVWPGVVGAQMPDDPASMLVFDGSGSMWARLEGDRQSKFYLARDALKAALAKTKPETQIGMAAFGHRRLGDCSDVQVLMPPETQAGGERLLGLIDKHNPRGKSPLANGIREAAKALPKGNGPRSLIVVHDDLDNCSLDPCAALADIRAAAPTVVIHAIGLGLKGDDAQRLQCLVKPTGGRLIDVQTSAALVTAVEEVLGLASATKVPVPAVPARSAPTAAAAAPAVQATVALPVPRSGPTARAALRKDGPPHLRLATLLGVGQLPANRDVQWTIRSVDPATPGRLQVAVGQDVLVPLPPGPYVVEGRDGLVRIAPTPVLVARDGDTGLDVQLDAGLIRAGFPTAGGVGRALLIEAADPTVPKAIVSLAQLVDGVPVPPGKWIVRLSEGLASRDVPIEIKAASVGDLGRTWPFARLALTLAGDLPASRFPPTAILYEDDPDAPRGRREILRATIGTGDIVVAAGTYAIVVRQGVVEARDRVVLVGGERLVRTINLAAAKVTLTSRLAGGAAGGVAAPTAQAGSGARAAAAQQVATEPVAYRLERLDVVPPDVFTSNRQIAELDVPAGRYRIEARHGLVNARAARDVVLSAGQVASITLEQQAGILQLAGPAGAVGDLLWEILDETLHPLWSTAQSQPVATLQAGRYIVRLDHRGKRYQQRVDVRAGDVRTIEMKD